MPYEFRVESEVIPSVHRYLRRKRWEDMAEALDFADVGQPTKPGAPVTYTVALTGPGLYLLAGTLGDIRMLLVVDQELWTDVMRLDPDEATAILPLLDAGEPYPAVFRHLDQQGMGRKEARVLAREKEPPPMPSSVNGQ